MEAGLGVGRRVPDDPGGLTGSQLISASDMVWLRANRWLSKPTAAFLNQFPASQEATQSFVCPFFKKKEKEKEKALGGPIQFLFSLSLIDWLGLV